MFKKTSLSLALAVAVAGTAALVSQQAMAMPSGTASDTVAAGEPYVNNDGLGQALIFPLYTVKKGQTSLFNITNTSDNAVAVKLRFHEGVNSRDVLDFYIVLSPRDVWTGYVKKIGGVATLKTTDKSCTVPETVGSLGTTTGTPFSNVAYTGVNSDGLGTSIARSEQGYMVAIATGWSDDLNVLGSVAHNSKHINRPSGTGVIGSYPFDCDSVDTAFRAASNVVFAGASKDGDAAAITEFQGFQPGSNPLKGNFSVIKKDAGMGAGVAAIAIADFANPAVNLNGNLISAQNFPFFSEPTLASRDGVWTMAGLPLVSAALASQEIQNEWANDPNTGEATDWVVTFPTKRFYVDHGSSIFAPPASGCTANTTYAARSTGRTGCAAANYLSDASFTGSFNALAASGSTLYLYSPIWDREENSSGLTITSPGNLVGHKIVNEASILAFGTAANDNDTNALSAVSTTINSPQDALAISIEPSIVTADNKGWMSLSFSDTASLNPTNPGSSMQTYPVTGFIYKYRNQGDTNKLFTQIMKHAYTD